MSRLLTRPHGIVPSWCCICATSKLEWFKGVAFLQHPGILDLSIVVLSLRCLWNRSLSRDLAVFEPLNPLKPLSLLKVIDAFELHWSLWTLWIDRTLGLLRPPDSLGSVQSYPKYVTDRTPMFWVLGCPCTVIDACHEGHPLCIYLTVYVKSGLLSTKNYFNWFTTTYSDGLDHWWEA